MARLHETPRSVFVDKMAVRSPIAGRARALFPYLTGARARVQSILLDSAEQQGGVLECDVKLFLVPRLCLGMSCLAGSACFFAFRRTGRSAAVLARQSLARQCVPRRSLGPRESFTSHSRTPPGLVVRRACMLEPSVPVPVRRIAPMPSAPQAGRLGWVLALLLVVATALFFWRLGERDLWSSHEARAAMNAASVLADGDALPRLHDGRPETQKPPLYYWLAAAAGLAARRGRCSRPSACPRRWRRWRSSLLVVRVAAVVLGRPLAGLTAGLILATGIHFPWLAHRPHRRAADARRRRRRAGVLRRASRP